MQQEPAVHEEAEQQRGQRDDSVEHHPHGRLLDHNRHRRDAQDDRGDQRPERPRQQQKTSRPALHEGRVRRCVFRPVPCADRMCVEAASGRAGAVASCFGPALHRGEGTERALLSPSPAGLLLRLTAIAADHAATAAS